MHRYLIIAALFIITCSQQAQAFEFKLPDVSANDTDFSLCKQDDDCVVVYESLPCPGVYNINKNRLKDALKYYEKNAPYVECQTPYPKDDSGRYTPFCKEGTCNKKM